jgi:hypothetical protein
MDINIQIKFNIGDKVWIPGLYYEWYPIKEEYEVDNIEIQIDSKSQRIFYLVKNKIGESCRYPERLCFGSYEECQRWCIAEK